ncbi:MAG: hypothetical protein NZ556_00680, partial [Fimbriimonadales bacterium]|nr:hypothetical protein [Fimbriimonadales bacterium]
LPIGIGIRIQAGFRSVGVTPTRLCGTGFQPVRGDVARASSPCALMWHGQSCPCSCLDTTVQATSRPRRQDADATKACLRS